MNKIILPISLLFLILGFGCSSGGGGDDDGSVTSDAEENSDSENVADENLDGKVWTIAEILSEPASGGAGGEATCGGELGFKRCICAPNVPSYVRYRPAVTECNGNAAAILSGRLSNVVSVVVRDTQNRDRWPAAGSGFGGCTFEEADSSSPPNRCSAFKVQSRFSIAEDTEIHCFGASGYSDLFADVARLTVKIGGPGVGDEEIERYCLNGPDLPLN